MSEFTMSHHALECALDMALDAQQIRDCFERLRSSHVSSQTGATYLTREKITLIVREDVSPPLVVTVIWATPNGWVMDQERGSYRGRDGSKVMDRAAFRARRGK